MSATKAIAISKWAQLQVLFALERGVRIRLETIQTSRPAVLVIVTDSCGPHSLHAWRGACLCFPVIRKVMGFTFKHL